MTVIVDTSVWSLALRRRSPTVGEQQYINELRELVTELRVAIIGPVRQELLSGISSVATYVTLRDRLRAFDDLSANPDDYETAAEFSNECRRHGIQGSHTDFLICAMSSKRSMSIFTTDNDFLSYASVLSIRLHAVRNILDQSGRI